MLVSRLINQFNTIYALVLGLQHTDCDVADPTPSDTQGVITPSAAATDMLVPTLPRNTDSSMLCSSCSISYAVGSYHIQHQPRKPTKCMSSALHLKHTSLYCTTYDAGSADCPACISMINNQQWRMIIGDTMSHTMPNVQLSTIPCCTNPTVATMPASNPPNNGTKLHDLTGLTQVKQVW
jgi:hypothetical protein